MKITTAIFSDLVPYSELLASIIGTVYYSKYKNTHLKYFLFLLWYITLTEFGAWYASENNILGFFDQKGRHYNYWFYNLLKIVTFSTLFYIYLKSISTKKYKLWIRIFFITYVIFVAVNWLFIQNFAFEMSEIPKTIGSIFLIVSILFYFLELLQSEKIVIFHKTLLFWISVGLLLFYTGTIPFSLKVNGYALIPGIHKLFLIVYILAIIMYSIFTFGFIWSKKESH